MNDIVARFRGDLARLWARITGRAHWACAPTDETHATYRLQYETLLPTLKHLPRGVHHQRAFERRNAFLYLAEILDGLHNYGDDPIMPPGVRRMLIRETKLWTPAPRGLLGAASPMTSVLTSAPALIAMAFAIPAIGGVIQTARLNHAKGDLADVRGELREANRSIDLYVQREAEYREAARVARDGRDSAVAAINREREITARERAALRRAQRDLETAARNRGEPIDWGLPVAAGDAATSGAERAGGAAGSR